MPTLLLIEDETTLAKNIARYLERHGWDVDVASSAEQGLARAAEVGPDVVVLDFQLPGLDGLAALARLRERDPQLRAVMLTGHGSIQLAVDAMKAGAADFLTKPVVLADLKSALDKLVVAERMKNALDYYRTRDGGGLDDLVGESPAMSALKDRIRRVMDAELNDSGGLAPAILISGETGSGKELVARACHHESRRRDAPFIELNCAAIPTNLLESELFGHERGAFTGARERRVGLVEAADGGTLFLDEIGEADAATQAKLLKVLEEQRVRRVGGVQERRVDVRIIAATNQPLELRVREGRFRADLLYRLRVIALEVPPLRARGDDIALLARLFVDQFARRYAKRALALSPHAIDALLRHDWPGNVRELRNVIEQAVLLARTSTIDAVDLALAPSPAPQARTQAAAAASLDLVQTERELVREALERSEWNVTQAARLLGVSRDTLRYRMEKHGLLRPSALPD